LVVRAINWLVYQSRPWAERLLRPRLRIWLAVPRWLSRFGDRLYFGTTLHRCAHQRRPRTRRRRMNAQYGPSRRLICLVVLLWALVLVLLAHLVVIVLHGPIAP